MAGGAASAWMYSGSRCFRSRIGRKAAKPDETELDELLPRSSSEKAAAAAADLEHATAVRQLLPAFWRHFWPFLKSSWRGRALTGATLLMCLLSAGLSSELVLLRAFRGKPA